MEEARGEIKSSGVTVVTSDAPSDYQLAPRTENPNLTLGSAAPPGIMAPAVAAGSGLPVKKKRGRPRKYGGPDAGVPRKTPPSPKPISSSVPPVIDFSAGKRGKIPGVGSGLKPPVNNSELSTGEWVPCSVGGSFAPHMITVNAGEDVTMKVISFSQQGPRAVCILSAIGAISSVTLRHPDSSGGTLTYEGRFEILSLAGSFMACEDGGGTKNRSGGMSISLVSPDGRVVGGCVAGLLVAASPVQIVVGSFLAANQKPGKLINEVCISSTHDQEAYPNPPAVHNQNPRNINQTDINVTPSG